MSVGFFFFFAVRSLAMFPINSNFLNKMRLKKQNKTAVPRANVSEMEHFLPNNESADSTVKAVMTTMVVHIRVCVWHQSHVNA